MSHFVLCCLVSRFFSFIRLFRDGLLLECARLGADGETSSRELKRLELEMDKAGLLLIQVVLI